MPIILEQPPAYDLDAELHMSLHVVLAVLAEAWPGGWLLVGEQLNLPLENRQYHDSRERLGDRT